MNVRSGWMLRLGGFLLLFGIGSLILPMFNMQFRILAWADPAQPFLGLAMTLAGIALLVIPFVKKARPEVAPAPVAGAYQGPAPMGQQSAPEFGAPGQFAGPAHYGQPGPDGQQYGQPAAHGRQPQYGQPAHYGQQPQYGRQGQPVPNGQPNQY